MKKFKFCAISLVLVLFLSISVQADNRGIVSVEFLPDKDYFTEFLPLMYNIVNHVNEFHGRMDDESRLSRDLAPIAAEDINFYKAYKEYVNFWVDIGLDNNLSERIAENHYYWVLPIQSGRGYYEVIMARGRPLSEEIIHLLTPSEIENIQRNEGKWGIMGMWYNPYHVNPYEYIREFFANNSFSILDNSRVYIVGAGLTRTNGALILTDDGRGYVKVIAHQ